jgi:hypothetical protein
MFFWKINFQYQAMHFQRVLQFIALLQAAVISANLHLKAFYRRNGAKIPNDFSDVVNFFKNKLTSALYFRMNL